MIEPGQIYRSYAYKDLYVIIERKHDSSFHDAWWVFNLNKQMFLWDLEPSFMTQYRRVA